MTLAEK